VDLFLLEGEKMRAPITDKHLLEMMWERFPEIMQRGIEQPAQQEPVAWRYTDARGYYRYRGFVENFDKEYPMLKPQALYTSPQPAQQQEPVARLVWRQGLGFMLLLQEAGRKLPEGNYDLYTPPPAQQQEPVATLKDEVIGCFNAAFVEGLQEALAETQDERLKDLVERRLMYALYAAQDTSPPAQRTWVGLTHEEHMEIMTGTMTTSSRMAAVEAKLREKNT
jgi:hypothetical protein